MFILNLADIKYLLEDVVIQTAYILGESTAILKRRKWEKVANSYIFILKVEQSLDPFTNFRISKFVEVLNLELEFPFQEVGRLTKALFLCSTYFPPYGCCQLKVHSTAANINLFYGQKMSDFKQVIRKVLQARKAISPQRLFLIYPGLKNINNHRIFYTVLDLILHIETNLFLINYLCFICFHFHFLLHFFYIFLATG